MPGEDAGSNPATDHGISFREALAVWSRIALLSFGGPAGQIALMHRILVDEKRWIGENRFLHALNYCMVLPGPEAQQLAIYIGWLLHRVWGGIVAGVLFVLPGFVAILALSVLYAGYRELQFVDALFYGLAPAVMAIVAEAVFRIGRRALKNAAMVTIAALAFIAIFVFEVPFPLIIIAAALVGFIGARWRQEHFVVIRLHEADGDSHALSDGGQDRQAPSAKRALAVTSICLALWFTPLVVLGLTLGGSSVFVQEGVFFSKAAVVTFGGAYAVLAYIAQQAVDVHGWLLPGEMLDGLGMAETTPGPLIQVVQFVGFMGAYRAAEAGMLATMHPMLAGALASLLVTWVTFVPCFLWIFLGAPYIERLRGNVSLTAALSGITAAVVGVVLNLAVWFALHTLFEDVGERHWRSLRILLPEVSTLDAVALAIALGAFIALFRYRLGMLRTLGIAVLIGLAYRLVFGG
ncbi:MAG: chromate efflux transporter [Pseudomonadota bacterium]|nr:MAG: chromate efflux transporter [Pseudomonadota bacterium]